MNLLLRRAPEERERRLTLAACGLIAIAIAAGLGGRTRRGRALLRSAAGPCRHGLRALRHRKNRIFGLVARARAALRAARERPSDDKLIARVRSRLGRVVPHPRAIRVGADEDYVVLTGRAPDLDIDAVVREVRKVRGVGEVDARLIVRCDTDPMSRRR
jgi:hypothetical protein